MDAVSHPVPAAPTVEDPDAPDHFRSESRLRRSGGVRIGLGPSGSQRARAAKTHESRTLVVVPGLFSCKFWLYGV